MKMSGMYESELSSSSITSSSTFLLLQTIKETCLSFGFSIVSIYWSITGAFTDFLE
jgi:hypothetical protein